MEGMRTKEKTRKIGQSTLHTGYKRPLFDSGEGGNGKYTSQEDGHSRPKSDRGKGGKVKHSTRPPSRNRESHTVASAIPHLHALHERGSFKRYTVSAAPLNSITKATKQSTFAMKQIAHCHNTFTWLMQEKQTEDRAACKSEPSRRHTDPGFGEHMKHAEVE